MSSLQERIAIVLAETGLGTAALARIADVKSSAVSQWKSGRIATLKAETAANIERHTGYRADWLATGRGTPKAHPVSQHTPQVGDKIVGTAEFAARTLGRPAAMLPVLPWERLQQMNLPNDRATFNALEHRSVPHAAGPCAKLVEVDDPAMLPRLGRGDVLQFDPDLQPSPGSIVLVRLADGRHLVRLYRQRAGGAWAAVPADENYAALASDTDGVQLVAVATHRIERLP